MKKKMNCCLSIAFLIFVLFLINLNTVSASELAKCTYNATLDDGTNEEITLVLNSDSSIKYSPLPLSEGGSFLDGSSRGIYYSLKGYSGALYINNKLAPKCPSLYFCSDSFYYSVTYTDGGNPMCTNGANPVVLNGNLENMSNSEHFEDKTKTYCEGFSTPKTSSDQYNIIFKLDVNGNKTFEMYINNDTNSGGETYFDGVIALNNFLFSVDQSLIDVYWNDENISETDSNGNGIPNCKEPIFFQYNNAAYESLVIVNKKPSQENSGSKDDATGFEDDVTDKDDTDLKFSPTSLCKDTNNCNINLNNFCAEPPVTRTLKFIGLLFTIAKILVPAIIIIMGIVNLIKIITSGKDDEVKKSVKAIVTRIIIGVVIFLLPSIINWIFTIADDIISKEEPSDFLNCASCIFDPENCVVTEKN